VAKSIHRETSRTRASTKISQTTRANSVLATFALALLALAATPSLSFADGTEEGSETAPQEKSTQRQDNQKKAPQEESLKIYEEIEIRERGDDLVGIAETASEGSTGAEQLAQRPILRAGELVETVPGIIATQHSGGGKANQYFLRGFNLDHGTDLAISVGGIPVNMPSHGHGQGWADLSFLIPEVVDRVRFHKGTAAAEHGDFAAAGAVDIDLKRSLDRAITTLSGGSDSYRRFLAADSFKVGGGDLLAGLEALHDDGPFTRGDDYERLNGLLRYSHGDARHGSSWTAMAYDGSWLSSDQIPLRAVEDGSLGRFDVLEPENRGATQRFSASAELHRAHDTKISRIEAYALYSDLDLFSNFTYFLDDPERGDQFEQMDRRFTAGGDISREWFSKLGNVPLEIKSGVQLRYDSIDNGLFLTDDRVRFETVRKDSIQLLTGGPYGEATARWSDRFRTTFGLRADFYDASVDSDLNLNSDDAEDVILSPKLSLAFGPWRDTELYVSLGRGFHSNDARGATVRVDPTTGAPLQRVQPLVRADGAEIGVRSSAWEGLQTTVSVFYLELDSELVFVGDAGGTEASRPSRRVGIEWTNFYSLRPSAGFDLDLDLDISLTDARFTDDPFFGAAAEQEIPGSLETVVAAGIAVSDLGPWFGSLRLRYFSGYPLTEDGSVRAGSSALVNGRIGYTLASGLSLSLEGFNLLDREDADVAYFYASRLPGEPAAGIEDVHFSPVVPLSARLTATWKF